MGMDPPAAYLAADLLQRLRADRGRERREHHAALAAAHAAGTELVPQERERRVLIISAPVFVLAVHALGLVRMQTQPDLSQPRRDRAPHLEARPPGHPVR